MVIARVVDEVGPDSSAAPARTRSISASVVPHRWYRARITATNPPTVVSSSARCTSLLTRSTHSHRGRQKTQAGEVRPAQPSFVRTHSSVPKGPSRTFLVKLIL